MVEMILSQVAKVKEFKLFLKYTDGRVCLNRKTE